MVIRIQTILGLDTFINVLVDELNKLNNKHVRVIIIDDIGDDIPESEDNINENYNAWNTNQFIWNWLWFVMWILKVKLRSSFYNSHIQMAGSCSQLLEINERPHFVHSWRHNLRSSLHSRATDAVFMVWIEIRKFAEQISFFMHTSYLAISF